MNQVSINEILDVINQSDNLNISENQLDDNLTTLGMDSITFIQIIVWLEEYFDCEIPDSKLIITEMDTVHKIFNVLKGICDEQLE